MEQRDANRKRKRGEAEAEAEAEAGGACAVEGDSTRAEHTPTDRSGAVGDSDAGPAGGVADAGGSKLVLPNVQLAEHLRHTPQPLSGI